PSGRPVLKKKAAGCTRASSSSIRSRKPAGTEGRGCELKMRFHHDRAMKRNLRKRTVTNRHPDPRGAVWKWFRGERTTKRNGERGADPPVLARLICVKPRRPADFCPCGADAG